MKILTLPGGRLEACAKQVRDTSPLRTWLADRWVILFSHPEDFAQEELETDRWVRVLSRSFGENGVAPLALARPGRDAEQGWLGHLASLDPKSTAVLALDPPPLETLWDLSVGSLRAQITGSSPRFAMITDSDLRCRRTLSYRLPAELPSPLVLIGWAVALRKRGRAEESPRRCSCRFRTRQGALGTCAKQ
jgi:hypothetical protein